MPELPEIHRYANDINAWTNGSTFSRIEKQPTGKGPDIIGVATPFQIFAEARGKEVKLTLTSASGPPTKITFRHGLVGGWQWTDSIPRFALLDIVSTEGKHLCFVDANRLGSWYIGDFDTKTRGPDPLKEYAAFRANIMGNAKTNAFNHPICEVLLDQKYFNGIGNYLRAEILYRACVSPHVNARELFESNSEAASRIIANCRFIPLQVLSLNLNKYGNPQEKAAFEQWLKVYGKSHFDTVKGRKIYYEKSQHLRDPDTVDTSGFENENVSSNVSNSNSNTFSSNNFASTPAKSSFAQVPAKLVPVKKLPAKQITTKTARTPRQIQIEPREKNVKQLLLAIAMLWKLGKITVAEKTWLKDCALQQHVLVYCALEAFVGDSDRDVDELADNLKRMYKLAKDPRDSKIYW